MTSSILGKGREEVVRLDVRPGDVERDIDRDDRLESSLELRVPLDGLTHRVIVQLVGEHDPTDRVERARSSIVNELLVEVVNIRICNVVEALLPVVRIPAPRDRSEIEPVRDRADTVIDIAVGRAPARRSYAGGELDGFDGVIELGEGIGALERGHIWVRPGVHADFVPVGDSTLRLDRMIHDIRADVEHGRLLALLGEEIVEDIVRAVGAIIETIAHRQRLGHIPGVVRETPVFRCRTFMTCLADGPPAVGIIDGVVGEVQ